MSEGQTQDQDYDWDSDKFHEECGVFGVYGCDDAAAFTALGLHALQHRGQEACGIVSYDGERYYAHKALGLVDATFNNVNVIEKLKGFAAIGHNSTSSTLYCCLGCLRTCGYARCMCVGCDGDTVK